MALISEYLAADSSPDASADALATINNSFISNISTAFTILQKKKEYGKSEKKVDKIRDM